MLLELTIHLFCNCIAGQFQSFLLWTLYQTGLILTAFIYRGNYLEPNLSLLYLYCCAKSRFLGCQLCTNLNYIARHTQIFCTYHHAALGQSKLHCWGELIFFVPPSLHHTATRITWHVFPALRQCKVIQLFRKPWTVKLRTVYDSCPQLAWILILFNCLKPYAKSVKILTLFLLFN